MIKAIHFKNFKALRDTTLPLGRLTLLVGANGSGKSTALEALRLDKLNLASARTVGVEPGPGGAASVTIEWDAPLEGVRSVKREGSPLSHEVGASEPASPPERARANALIDGARVYSFDAAALAAPAALLSGAELGPNGQGLAVVLDRLRQEHPQRWDALNEHFCFWMREFDRIVLETSREDRRAIMLRRRTGGYVIPADELSRGTLLALGVLTLAYLPDPPPIMGLEEPDRGIHPRLLRHVQDAMYRFAFPESFGDKRPAPQLIATTHSPYLVDLFKDHFEEIVTVSRTEDNVQFQRLSEIEHIEEILEEGAPLGEIWYTGIFGGGPC